MFSTDTADIQSTTGSGEEDNDNNFTTEDEALMDEISSDANSIHAQKKQVVQRKQQASQPAGPREGKKASEPASDDDDGEYDLDTCCESSFSRSPCTRTYVF